MQKISEEAKITYISYINYSEGWILILRLIIRQNLCRIVTQAYLNPTWRKKCRVARPSGFCDSLLDTFGKRRISIISGFIWIKPQDYADAPSARSLHLRNLRFLSCIQRNCKKISRWITVLHDYHANHAVGKETN